MKGPVRVAVVDDELFTREAVSKLLRAHYGEAVEAIEFATVEQLLEYEGEDFDVVVLDLRLRGGRLEGDDGVRAAVRRGPVLVFSSVESGEALERVHRAGARGFVGKDAGAEQALVEGIDAVLAGGSFVDQALLAKVGASARRQLTARQQEVLRLEALGCNVDRIALELGLTQAGVRRHIERIVEIHPDRAKADRVRLAVDLGLVTPWETSKRYPDPPQ
jgi:DNA-binding NarL/FixJ family response regulator